MKTMALIAVILLGLGAAACSPIRREKLETRTVRRVIKLGNVRSVRAEMAFGIGQVKVTGGTKELMDGKFVIGGEPLKVDYTSRGKLGTLAIEHPDSPKSFFSSGRKRKSHLKLNNNVPLDLRIDLGVGSSHLALGGLNIEQVDIDSGVGKTIVDLRGRWDHDVDVDVDSGVGAVKLLIPLDFPVRIDFQQGIGDFEPENLRRKGRYYVNAAGSQGKHGMDITIDQGVGSVAVE